MAGAWQVEVVPWNATQPLPGSEQRTFSLSALGSTVVAHHSIDALLQPHNVNRTGAHIHLWVAPTQQQQYARLCSCHPCVKVQTTSAGALLRITARATPADGGSDSACSSCSEVYLSEFRDAAMRDPDLSASDFEQVMAEARDDCIVALTSCCASYTMVL
jgi:hypothetical protein